MEGNAEGFWAGMSFGIGYIVLRHAGLLRLDSLMAVTIMFAVMVLGYVVGRVLATKRYR
jgi:hypothetical protein